MARRAKNEGTIYKKTIIRNGKEYTYWESQVTIGYDPGTGKRIRKTYTGNTQKEVRVKMQHSSLDIENEDYIEPSKMTLAEWMDAWLSEHTPHVKPQSRRLYKIQCDSHIKPSIGNIKLSELTTKTIQHLYNNLASGGNVKQTKNPDGTPLETRLPLSPTTVKNISTTLSACLNTAVELGYIKNNPASKAKSPKLIKKEQTPLTNEQIRKFLELIETDPYKNIFKLILFTGLRRGEALGLTWDSINITNRTLTINKQLRYLPSESGSYTLGLPKRDKIRILSIPQSIIDILLDEKIIQEQNKLDAGPLWSGYKDDAERETSLIFTSKLGTPIDFGTLHKHYKNIVKTMGIPDSHIHQLRHTYAVLSIQNGDDIKTIQNNLGHASAAFTLDIYGHTTDKMKEEAANRMQTFIEKMTRENDNDE